MATKTGQIAEGIIKAIKAGNFSPIYLLYGEDSYSINQMIEFMENSILTEDEREFNQTILYGAEITVDDVIMNANRFPMMSEYQVVIVKEAQLLKEFKNIEPYVDKPQTSTILVLAFHSKNADKRIKAVQKIAKDFVMLEFPAIKEDQMQGWLMNYFKSKEFAIEPKAAVLLGEFTGPDLSRASMEADKLMLNEKKGYLFTANDLEKHVGLNKEYNIFELQNALSRKDIFASNSIALYIAKNQKERPLPVIISLLYSHFAKILTYQYLKSKGEPQLDKALGVWPGKLKEFETAARNYSPAKLIHVIHHLRRADLQFKGYHAGSIETEGILKELIFKIIH